MKIYTKGGDQGETGLYGGSRVPKDHLRIQVYGTLDETNAVLGHSIAELDPVMPGDFDLKGKLVRIQAELFQLGAELATPEGKRTSTALVGIQEINRLEEEIDRMEEELEPLKTFILPGGSLVASSLHLARTVCRRAERELLPLTRAEKIRPEVIQYLNRLSDHLFVCARFVNHLHRVADVPWIAPKT